MAIKDQCSQCKFLDGDMCLSSSSRPSYDQTSCAQYVKRGINLQKEEKGNPAIEENASLGTDHSIPMKQRMFRRPFSFKGRIRRLEYGLSYIVAWIYAAFASVMNELSGGGTDASVILWLIPFYWFLFAQGAKRCHDRGNSGWYQLIPFYGLWLLFGDSDKGDNEYGPNPKGEN